ncbi:unnamed protein product [Rotaria sp. Silwood1]|nr:unnamed protein product [Rotaria sp. Silwood1]
MTLSIEFIILFLLSIPFVFGQYPLPPDPPLLPIPPTAYLHGSTIIFTQRALQLAPSIFHKFIDDGIQYIRDQLNQIPDQNRRGDCCDSLHAEDCARMEPISASGIYSPFYGIAIRYRLVSAVLRANQDIRAYISVVIYVLNPITQKWLIYQDYDRERSVLYPPFEWPSPGLSLPLASLRVGSNVMNAISSAFESLGTFKSNVNDIIEDVFFDEQIYWYVFKISIFRQDEALLHVDYVSTNVTCQFNRFNCSNSAFDNSSTMCNVSEDDIQKYAVPFLSGTITNIDMNIVMLMTLVNNRPGVYLNGTYINSEKLNITIKAAPLPIPSSAEEALLKHMILRSLPIINSIFIKNPLLLPNDTIPYFPNPTSHLYPQVNKQGKNIGYGYIDIASYEMNSTIHEHKLVSHISNTRTTTTCTTNVESIRPHPSDIASLGGIYLSIFESEYDDTIQNTNCSIAQEGFEMSSYALPTTTYINSTTWNDTCTVIAQCMDTSEFFDSNLQYYSLLQDSTTGSILALSFMCSDPQCQRCQYQQSFCKENNPTEKCLLGKYFYRFNQTLFSFKIALWEETTIKTCTIKTKPTTTIIPQLDFHYILSLILLSQLCLLLIPTFVYDFFQCMNIRPSTDTFIQRDPDTQSIELYYIQSIRTGIIIGYILYLLLIRKHLEKYIILNNNQPATILSSDGTDSSTNLYINTYISCMRLVIYIVELINLIGCLLPAILIYQIKRHNLSWLIIWSISKNCTIFYNVLYYTDNNKQ